MYRIYTEGPKGIILLSTFVYAIPEKEFRKKVLIFAHTLPTDKKGRIRRKYKVGYYKMSYKDVPYACMYPGDHNISSERIKYAEAAWKDHLMEED